MYDVLVKIRALFCNQNVVFSNGKPDAINEKFEVKVIKKTIVTAEGTLPETHVISLSSLNLLSGRFSVTYIFFYKSLPSSCVNNDSFKDALSQCLGLFYPFAGKVSENPESGEPEIICDNSGVLLVEAQANICLKDFDFHDLNQCLHGKLVPVDLTFSVCMQVTCFTSGGISVTFTFDHALGDASAFSKFLLTLSETALGKLVSCFPDHSRNLLARVPPSYDPAMEELFVSCTLEEIQTIPTFSFLVKRLYFIDKSSIDSLQKLASAQGNQKTKIEAFSAYIWKVMANAINKEHKSCRMGWLVDGRTRLSRNQDSLENYIGNVLSLAFGELDVMDLSQGSIARVADIVHEAIAKATNEAHFRNLIDWIECHRPGLMLSKSVLGRGGHALVVSSGRIFPVAELDFGFGSPVLGTVCSTIERLGVGYINQRQSASRDGSWTVSTILWPEIAAALESDPNQIFQPMNRKHIQL